MPAREMLRTSSRPGRPAIARSTGAVTYVSTSIGPSAGACVMTCTWTFVTSGTASIGTLRRGDAAEQDEDRREHEHDGAIPDAPGDQPIDHG